MNKLIEKLDNIRTDDVPTANALRDAIIALEAADNVMLAMRCGFAKASMQIHAEAYRQATQETPHG